MKQKGFTIVELLIVIVVIGILAALVITNLSNAQSQARNSQTITAVQAYAKALIGYGTEHGAYPAYSNNCLGQGYGTAAFESCWSGATMNTTLNNRLSPYLGSTAPQPSLAAVNTSGPDATQWFRGVGYNNNGSYGRYLLYVIENSSTCPEISGLTQQNKTTYSTSSHVTCRGSLPPLN